jgi:hypothetical protein
MDAPRPERRLDRLAQHLDGLGAQFDGRLRVMFGAPGAPVASVRDAVLASCAVPWLFAPVEIGGASTSTAASPERLGGDVCTSAGATALGAHASTPRAQFVQIAVAWTSIDCPGSRPSCTTTPTTSHVLASSGSETCIETR